MTTYSYPKDIEKTTHVQFKFWDHELKPPSQQTVSKTGTGTKKVEFVKSKEAKSESSSRKTSVGDIVNLYVQGGIGTDIDSTWSMKEVPIVGSVDAGQGLETIKQSLSNTLELGTQVATKVVASKIMKSEAVTSIMDGINANTGYSILPNTAMVFGGASPETAPFSFSFTPRNQDEAKQTLGIINAFKKASTSQTIDTGILSGSYRIAKAPPIFSIAILPGGGDDTVKGNSFYKFPDMVLTKFDVKFSEGEAFFQMFSDNRPVSATLSLSFASLYSSQQQDGEYRLFGE